MTLRNPRDQGWPERGERTDDPEVAARWIWSYVDLHRGETKRRLIGGTKSRRLSDAIAEYLAHRRSTVEYATWKADRTALAHLQEHAGGSLSAAGPKLQPMFNALQRQRYKATTLRTYAVSLSAFFSWAGIDMPVLALPNPGKADVATLDPKECARMRAAAKKVDKLKLPRLPNAVLAVEIGLSMGLREGEIFALRWEDIDPSDKSVRVQWQVPKEGTAPKPLKGKSARTVLIMPEWWAHHRRAKGFIFPQVSQATRRSLIRRVLETAGLYRRGMGFHILRHTYALHFLEKGLRMEWLQLSLGHSSIVITQQRYGHLREDVAIKLARGELYGT